MNIRKKLGSSFATIAVSAIAATALLVAGSASAATVYSDGFESANFNNWTQVETGTVGMWKIDTNRFTGKYSALVTGNNGIVDDVMRKAIPTDVFANASVSFMFKASSLDYKVDSKTGATEFDRFFAEYTTDGTNWTLIKEVNGQSTTDQNGSWYKVTASVPSSANFQIRFRAHLSDSGDRVNIDDVTVSGDPTEMNKARCSDKIDNDLDGKIDSSDSDCAAFYSTLSVSTAGMGSGTVTSSPFGISCTTGSLLNCAKNFLKEVSVSLQATAKRGSVFAGWTGACAGPGNCLVSMETDKSVSASFDMLPSFLLTTENVPADGGAIGGLGINCGTDCSETVYLGENVTVTAFPARGFAFDHWSGSCDTTTTSCMINTVSSDVSAVANYRAVPPGICANNVVEWNESCDDGNLFNGDGCDASCQLEPVFICTSYFCL